MSSVAAAKKLLGETVLSMLPKVVRFNPTEKLNTLRSALVNMIIEKTAGCQERCKLCGTGCTNQEAGHEGQHESEFHSYSGIIGYVESSDRKGNNNRTCQVLMHWNQTVQDPEDAKHKPIGELFAKYKWRVDPKNEMALSA